MLKVLGCSVAFVMAAPCLAQTTPPAKDEGQIVVRSVTPGIQNLPVQTKATPFFEDNQESAVGIADARRFLRCMHEVDPKLLQNVVDRAAKDFKAKWSLDRLVRQRTACHGSMFAEPQPVAPYYGDCNPIAGTTLCRSVFDRGVLFEYALTNFAPDLQLTRAELSREDVRRRFLKRELPKVRLRYPEDQRYFDVVSCVVQLRPEESLELIRASSGSTTESRLEALLIASAPACFGNAKSVTVDSNQFRLYIAQAVYNWAVAVKGVDSLVPRRS